MRTREQRWSQAFPEGFNALVTGASRGIGLELTRQIRAAETSGRVFGACRSPDSAAELAALDNVERVPLDVEREPTIRAAAGRVAADLERLHLLINCAGVLHTADGMQPEKSLARIDPDNLARAFRINASGPVLVLKHFQRLLQHKDHAVVANISARVGSIGDNRLGGWYAYRASKAAQNQFTRTAAIELRRRAPNLVCIALHPGTVATDLSAPFRDNTPPEKVFDVERAARQLLAVIGSRTPDHNGGFFAWDGQPVPW